MWVKISIKKVSKICASGNLRKRLVTPGYQISQSKLSPSYTVYLTNKHNSDMRLDRSENKGMLEPKYEQTDELADLELPPPTSDFTEEPDMPSVC